MRILIGTRWIDASGVKKFGLLVWSSLATALTVTLAMAWERELSGGRGDPLMILTSLFFASFIVGLYHVGIYQVARSTERGAFIDSRLKKKVIGSVLAMVGLFSLWVANSSNIFYFSSRDDALKTDVEKLTSAFDGLEKSGKGYFEGVLRAYETNSKTLEANVWNEMTGSARAGIGASTRIKIDAFNAYVGQPVEPQTVDVPWNSPKLMREAENISGQLKTASVISGDSIRKLKKEFADEFERPEIKEIRSWLESQRARVKEGGLNPDDEPASVAKLRDGFRLFSDVRSTFDRIAKDPSMGERIWLDDKMKLARSRLPEVEMVNNISKTPLSSDMRMVGRLFMSSVIYGDWRSLVDLAGGRLIFAMFMSALFELGVGFMFWLLIQRR